MEGVVAIHHLIKELVQVEFIIWILITDSVENIETEKSICHHVYHQFDFESYISMFSMSFVIFSIYNH